MAADALLDLSRLALLPFGFWAALACVTGCCVGSFLNVVIHRLPRDQSLISPGSHCPACQYAIPWHLNIPLVTWLLLRGRCRNCGAPISARYFIVELLTGLAFLGCWWAYGRTSPGMAIAYCVMVAGLIAGAFIDWEHFIIPDEITLGGIGAGLLFSFLVPRLHGEATVAAGLRDGLIGAAVGWAVVFVVLRVGKLFFGRQRLDLQPDTRVIFAEHGLLLPDREIPYEDLLYRPSDTIRLEARTVEMVDRGYANTSVRLRQRELRIGDDTFDPEQVPCLEVVCSRLQLPREAMGFGDVKFMAAVGAFLGWQATIFCLFGSSVLGAVIGGGLLLLRRGQGSRQVPYIPYMAVATVVWIFGGREWMEALFLRR